MPKLAVDFFLLISPNALFDYCHCSPATHRPFRPELPTGAVRGGWSQRTPAATDSPPPHPGRGRPRATGKGLNYLTLGIPARWSPWPGKEGWAPALAPADESEGIWESWHIPEVWLCSSPGYASLWGEWASPEPPEAPSSPAAGCRSGRGEMVAPSPTSALQEGRAPDGPTPGGRAESRERRGLTAGLASPRSSAPALGDQGGGGDLYLENITRILDKLLDGYDNRLRPGFGGTGKLPSPRGARERTARGGGHERVARAAEGRRVPSRPVQHPAGGRQCDPTAGGRRGQSPASPEPAFSCWWSRIRGASRGPAPRPECLRVSQALWLKSKRTSTWPALGRCPTWRW